MGLRVKSSSLQHPNSVQDSDDDNTEKHTDRHRRIKSTHVKSTHGYFFPPSSI